MTDLEILNSLLKNYHLNNDEIRRAKEMVHVLNLKIKNSKRSF